MATVSSQPQVQRSKNPAVNANTYLTPASVRSDRKTVSTAATVPALHSDVTIGVATFLGGIIAGAILVSRNHFLLGKKADAIALFVAAIVWVVFLVGVALSLPDEPILIRVFFGVITLGHAFGMLLIAQNQFAEQYAAITAGRGRWGHWGWALLAIAIPLVPVVSILFFSILVFVGAQLI